LKCNFELARLVAAYYSLPKSALKNRTIFNGKLAIGNISKRPGERGDCRGEPLPGYTVFCDICVDRYMNGIRWRECINALELSPIKIKGSAFFIRELRCEQELSISLSRFSIVRR
jgi:hypothetical protein